MAKENIRIVQELGNSLMISIPSQICRDIGLQKGDEILFAQKGGAVLMTVVRR
jgi:antitoxin component of MazEF toxin-antitoxin module